MPNGVVQSIIYDCLQLKPANSYNISHISNSSTMQQQACNDTDIAVSAAVSASVLQDARLDGLVYLIRGAVLSHCCTCIKILNVRVAYCL
jgi:hypothetical protein